MGWKHNLLFPCSPSGSRIICFYSDCVVSKLADEGRVGTADFSTGGASWVGWVGSLGCGALLTPVKLSFCDRWPPDPPSMWGA